jgi:UDP-3-O-[3-hydroxymyristoyl] glucosamine N-acyltransferase
VTVELSLAELAGRLGAELVGDGAVKVRGVRPLNEAGPSDLSFLHNTKYAAEARRSKAGAILVSNPELAPSHNLLVMPQPYLGLAHALEILCPEPEPEPGVHPSAAVDPEAALGEGVSVGAQAAIGPRCVVGAGTIIGAGVVLGPDVTIGEGCRIHPRVVVQRGCRIGNRCVLQPGVIIGGDGFGFATVDGVHHKVPQVGIVVVEDDVEIGSNTCIDRATLGETRIGRGTKIDNLVQVAHNVQVGEGSLLVAQVGISGSTSLGHHVIMAGQSGAAGHLKIGDRVIIGAKSAVIKDVDAGQFVTGFPAQPHRDWLKMNVRLRQLEKLEKRLSRLEAMLNEQR